MKIITKQLLSNHNIFLFGDSHIGNALRHKKGFDKMMNMMHSEYEGVPAKGNYGIDHGDIIEAITIDDPRISLEGIKDAIPTVQMAQAVKEYRPIAHKMLFMCEGNHPFKLWRFGPITQLICDELKIPYGTWSAKLVARDARGQLLYKSFHTHGRKSITSTADDPKRRIVNQRLILKRHLKFKMGDCILMCKGHVHKLIVCGPESELYMKDDGVKIKQAYTMDHTDQTDDYIHPDHRTYVCTGSFLRLYGEDVSGYAEIAEYDPLELGFCIARIRNRKLKGVDVITLD